MTLRDGEQSLELQPGELPGVYELGEEADNYLYQCITSGLISRAYHSRGLKITDRERQRLFANIVNTRRCNACPSVCFGEFYLDWSLYFIFLSLPFFSRFCWICIFLLRDNLQNVCENVCRLYKTKCNHSFSTYILTFSRACPSDAISSQNKF